MSVQSLKAALRAEMRRAIKALAAEQRLAASAAACAQLQTQPIWRRARTILGYVALPDELELAPLLVQARAAGKIVALPRYVANQSRYEAAQIQDLDGHLVPGRYGIGEPAAGCASFPLNQLDLALVPGVCFDLMGRRLGRGRGYYDQLLESVRGIRCGVGWDVQVRSEIPVEPHDAVLDCILTPTRWISLNRRAD
ncbi:MAG: 5-formyltetrahydrofolate cyclo-ligase [Verrucomicrobia bacterium]|nr:5-formyltetrahydrofolate cyclo-ligase [Verrucomicrobiota bacterium]